MKFGHLGKHLEIKFLNIFKNNLYPGNVCFVLLKYMCIKIYFIRCFLTFSTRQSIKLTLPADNGSPVNQAVGKKLILYCCLLILSSKETHLRNIFHCRVSNSQQEQKREQPTRWKINVSPCDVKRNRHGKSRKPANQVGLNLCKVLSISLSNSQFPL